MSGPIVRTGTTPEFWKNWDRVFGNEKAAAGDEASGAGSSGKSGKKPAKAGASAKSAAKKKAGKAASKKSS
jgi:hypothetical protein